MSENSIHWLDCSKETVELPRLTPEFDGYRLIQLSDIHFGTWINGRRLAKVVAWVNARQPDSIAITGDFVSRTPERYANELSAVLADLAPRDVTVAVLGNHDHWTDPDAVGRILEASKIVHLKNGVHTVTRGRAGLHLAGVDCTYLMQDRLDSVLAMIPGEGAAVLLAHEPDYADISAATGRFGLQISGHSHGGQIVLPKIGAPVLPPHGRKYPTGRYQMNGMVQYTNRGLGTAHFRVRFNCRAEVTEFTLRGKSDGDVGN